MSEQIFISYRREGGDITAKLICEALKNNGYTVFYDYDSISGGYFDKRIFDAIKNCKDFVLVLPKGSLERCVNEDDWVRQEIAFALAHKKNIIPVMLPEFSFPQTLPKDIEDIARINGVHFVMAYFDGVMSSITERLISKPHHNTASASSVLEHKKEASTTTYSYAEKPATPKADKVEGSSASGKKSSPVKIIVGAIIALVLITVPIVAILSQQTGLSGESDEYFIKTVEDLQKLANSDVGTKYYLKNDIDFAGASVTPIEGFKGELVGNGFTISNFKVTSTSSGTGLFGVLEGKVSDLKITGATVEVSGRCENVGILCGELKGVISNVTVDGSVVAEKSTNVGGVCGLVSTQGSYTIEYVTSNASVSGLSCVGGCFGKVSNSVYDPGDDCSNILSNVKNTGKVTATEDYAGGIVAFMEGDNTGIMAYVDSTIIDCENTGEISGGYYVAGIVGYAVSDGDSVIDGCTNASVINAKAQTGCIAGYISSFVTKNSSNKGSTLNASGYYLEDGKKYAYVGGLVGNGVCFENCTNYIDIDYTGGGDFVGGVMGYCRLGSAILNETISSDTAEAYFKNLVNEGNISGNSYVGGIMGGIQYYWDNGCTKVTASFEALINTGDVIGTDSFVGGISGYMSGDVGGMGGALCWIFYDSENEGAITGSENVGGLFGGFRNGQTEGMCYVENTVLMDGCTSSGNVSAESNFGDLIGLDEIKR